MSRRAAVLVAAALALAAPAAASADAVTSEELAALADRAATDPAARERLRAVDRVDGHAAAVGEALAGARGGELARRARLLAASARARGEVAGEAPAADRRRAGEILDDGRYTGTDLPRPFAGPLEWLGDRIGPVIAWVSDRGTTVPGGPLALWLSLAALVLLAATGVTSTTIRRRTVALERARAAALPATEDPHALEREAERAERGEEWERAVRLRFRAGLLRLDGRNVLVYRPSLTTGEVARAVEAPAFAELGERFDAIAYGGRPAEREDAEHARRAWHEVLAR